LKRVDLQQRTNVLRLLLGSGLRAHGLRWFRSVSLIVALPLAIWLTSGWFGLIVHWNPGPSVIRHLDSVTSALGPLLRVRGVGVEATAQSSRTRQLLGASL
jgi:hypothetical protein